MSKVIWNGDDEDRMYLVFGIFAVIVFVIAITTHILDRPEKQYRYVGEQEAITRMKNGSECEHVPSYDNDWENDWRCDW